MCVLCPNFLREGTLVFKFYGGQWGGKVTPGHAPDTDIKIEKKYRIKIVVNLKQRSTQNLVVSYLTRQIIRHRTVRLFRNLFVVYAPVYLINYGQAHAHT